MSTISDNNKRIAKNTILLYFRMIFIMVINLYTSRVILLTLGIEDYGIYTVVGGLIAMMGIFNDIMSAGTSRFLTFSLGKEDIVMANKTFNVSLVVNSLLCIILLMVAESVGIWFLNHKLIIPPARLAAANWVYQFSILAAFIQLMAAPYNAAIIAHEKMDVFAYISIIEVMGKLVIVYFLYISPFDKLITYGALTVCLFLLIMVIYKIYCNRNFDECTFKICKDKTFYKEILSYSGWNLFGPLANFGRSQGLNILINLFFSPSVCAARGIAYQVNAYLSQFATNFYTAVKPQITKYYAKGQLQEMERLVFRSSKMSFYLNFLISLPVMMETPFIIRLWLGQLPEYVVVFIRLIVVFSSITSMAHPLMTVVHATGKIAACQSLEGILHLSILPISYFFLKEGYTPPSVFVIAILIMIVTLFLRLWFTHHLVGLPFWKYIVQVVGNALLVASLSCMLPLYLHCQLPDGWLTSLMICGCSVFSSLLTIYLVGLNTDERRFIKNSIIYKILRKQNH